MIIGNIKDFGMISFPGKNIEKAVSYALSHDLLALPLGKVEIKGEDIYLNRQSYLGKDEKDSKIEGHEHYLDLQLVLQGEERFGYVDKRREGLKLSAPYDPLKDKANYEGPVDGYITLHAGQFALVFPNDLHQPGIKVNEAPIEKAVFKIKIDY